MLIDLLVILFALVGGFGLPLLIVYRIHREH